MLKISKKIATLSQHEKKCVAACGPVIKQTDYTQLCDNTVNLVDHDTWGLKAVAPRTPVSVDKFTNIGKTTLTRERLEMERRFMNNTNDHLTFQDQVLPNGHVGLTARDKGALFLDMRIVLEPLIMGNEG